VAFVKPSSVNTGTPFFAPKNFNDAVAILFEPTKFLADQPAKEYGTGRDITEDRIVAHLTIFKNTEELANGTPSETGSYLFTHKGIVNTLKGAVGNQQVGIVRKKPGKAGAFWSIMDVDAKTEQQVVDFYAAREKAAEADLPEFLQ
jgi:hypothetical protein